MRSSLPLLALSLLALGCQSASHSPAIPGVDSLTQSLPTYDLRAGEESLVAMFAVTVDPSTMSATASPIRGAQAQPPQGQTYDLDIDRFLTSQTFKIVGLETDGAGDFVVTFSHAHPFPACNVANPPTALNRADLGYTGRLMLLVNNDPVSFFANEVILDPNTIVAPDGYIQPGDLLAQIGEVTGAAYPYVLLADDGEDNRVNLPNGGPKGNYDTAISGWQRSNIGVNGEGWTGYDYVHGGQTITNTFTVSAAALASGTQTFGAAILIKYTDPRGAGGPVNRIPPEPKKVLDFAYRLPYAALDMSVVDWDLTPTIAEGAGEETTLAFEVRDWDAKATEAADSTVGDENNVALVQLGASGIPTAQFQCPAIRTNAVSIPVIANSRNGSAGSELQYSGTLTNSLGTAAPGAYPGCLRLIDPEDGDPAASSYHFGVDAVTLAGDPARALNVKTYQVIFVGVGVSLTRPVVQQVFPTGIIGVEGSNISFSAVIDNNPTSWSWNFGGGAIPNNSTDQNPDVDLGAPGSYTGALIATNAAGASNSFPFQFQVGSATAKPSIVSVSPIGEIACPRGGQVTFSAEILNGVSSYLWNFGAGVTPEFATVAEPDVTALEPGSYSGTLIATNAQGESAPFPFSYEISGLWKRMDSERAAEKTSLLIYNGRPVAVSENFSSATSTQTISFHASTVPVPTLESEWVYHTITVVADVASADQVLGTVAVVNDRLMFSFGDHDNLRIATANVSSPTLPGSAADWSIHTVGTLSTPTGDDVPNCLVEILGKPLIAAYEFDYGNGRVTVYYARTTSSLPTQTSDWTIAQEFTISTFNDNLPFSSLVYQPSGSPTPLVVTKYSSVLKVEGAAAHGGGLEAMGIAANGTDPRIVFAGDVSEATIRIASVPIPAASTDYLSIDVGTMFDPDNGVAIAYDADNLVILSYSDSYDVTQATWARVALPQTTNDWDTEEIFHQSIEMQKTGLFLPSGQLFISTSAGGGGGSLTFRTRTCHFVP